MAEFLINDKLYSAYQELIYNYSNSEWNKAWIKTKKYEAKYEGNIDIPHEVRQSVWKAFNPEEILPVGSRRYHPMFFQGSLEEQRLDRVLHYFDIIAYHWSRGVISIEDISGTIGYHLGIIRKRDVIQRYLKLNADRWDLLSDTGEPPFTKLKALLDKLEKKQKKELERWQKRKSARHLRREAKAS